MQQPPGPLAARRITDRQRINSGAEAGPSAAAAPDAPEPAG
jgi:hypothetical protein